MNFIKKTLKVVGIVFVGMLVLAILFGSRDIEGEEDLRAEIDQLKATIELYEETDQAQLVAQIDSLTDENKELTKENEQLENQKENLALENKSLVADKEKLAERNSKLSEEKEFLAAKVNSLESSHTANQPANNQSRTFNYSSVSFRDLGRDRIELIGEVTNNSGNNYQVAYFDISIYNSSGQLIATQPVSISNLNNGNTRSFSTRFSNININNVDKYRIQFSTGL